MRELLSDSTAMGEPENVRVILSGSIEHSRSDGGELGDRRGSYRRWTATDPRRIETDHGSPLPLLLHQPCEGAPARERAGHPVYEQERIAFALNLHRNLQPPQERQMQVDQDRT
jgi:hypothetical protein